MATLRKRRNKWQAIVRHKEIGSVSKSFFNKSDAGKWSLEQETRLELGLHSELCLSDVKLETLLKRYKNEVICHKSAKKTEQRRLNRLINDPISTLTVDKLSSSAKCGLS